ncbi:penicillin-binding protein 1C [uncultured Rikenella sp.]|uniref:penicillin-binding protein 1C n=1 Tax=uncultured Rikenella sp. TaxID=368003 RepID=UPI00262CBD99|nr:penicillin-binding protein 1C [uncultured Rikenella sp.]
MNRNPRHKRHIALTITLLTAAVAGYVLLLPRPLFRTPYSTVLYSRQGELLGAKVAEDGQWRFPPGRSLSQKYVRAVIEYEDRRFYRHGGVSLPALVRAALQNYRQGKVVSGGSTLTMQLVRLSRGNPPRTVGEKLREMLIATRIEWSYTKEEILSLYAAHAPFGGNVAGVEAAAWRYFGHDPGQLSWAEAATLAVLPNSPALIHPGRSREALLDKRNRLLGRLLRTHALDSTEYAAALIEPLPAAPEPLPRQAPHLMDRLPAGTALRSTLDNTWQQRVRQIVDNYGRRTLAANRIRNAAALVADVQTGEVLAYVGNITPLDSPEDAGDGRAVDIIRSRRSTGSLLKPILYGAMLGEGQILPRTLVFDTPLNIAGFTPSNYSKTFSGAVPAGEAVARSLNVPVVRMLTQYNASRFLSLLRSMGLTTFDRSADNYGATLILGGAEGTLWEMTGLYASLARSLETYNHTGHYEAGDMRPLSFTSAQDGPAAADRGGSGGICPLSPAALWFMFEAMSGVNRPEEEAAWQEFSSMKQIAWKTGTSYGNRDAWAIGLTPRHIVGVWVGNADGEGRAAMTGVGYAAPILFDIFSMLPAADGWFAEPLDDMETAAVCRRSGHRATEWCRSSGDPIDTVHIPRAGISSPLCPYHKPVTADGVTRGWFVLPPAAEYYYRQTASDYAVPPAVTGSCPLELIYPQPGAVLYLPKGFAGGETAAGRFIFRAAHRSDSATLYWHLDQTYLGSTRSASAAGHAVAVSPAAGEHRLTVVDDRGNRQRIRFTVLRSDEGGRRP